MMIRRPPLALILVMLSSLVVGCSGNHASAPDQAPTEKEKQLRMSLNEQLTKFALLQGKYDDETLQHSRLDTKLAEANAELAKLHATAPDREQAYNTLKAEVSRQSDRIRELQKQVRTQNETIDQLTGEIDRGKADAHPESALRLRLAKKRFTPGRLVSRDPKEYDPMTQRELFDRLDPKYEIILEDVETGEAQPPVKVTEKSYRTLTEGTLYSQSEIDKLAQ